MGSFRFNPVSVNFTGGSGWTPTAGTILDALANTGLAHINQNNNANYCDCPPGTPNIVGPATGDYIVEAVPGSAVLDGTTTVDLLSLPVGFLPITVAIHFKFNFTNPVVALNTCVTALSVLYDNITVSNLLSFANGLTQDIPVDASSELNQNILTLFGATWKIMFTEHANNPHDFSCGPQLSNDANLQINGFYLTGGYDIISSSWRLTNLTHPNSTTPLTVYPGDRVRIDTPDNSYDFSTITEVHFPDESTFTDFYVVFNIDFLVWTPIGIEFLIPVFPIPTVKKKILELDIQGTQFSGRAHFTEIQVVIANASGMYTIVTDKTSDTLYTDSSSGNTTIEAKIPDPFIKTGFIGA